MNERIKQLRKDKNLTQEEFADKINISRAHLGSLEIGRTGITDRVVTDICRAFNVNELWLRTGKGDIYDKSSELGYLLGKLAADNNEFKKRFISFMLRLPDDEWVMIENMIIEFNNYLDIKK